MSSHKPWLLVREPAYFQAVLGCMVKFDRTAKDNPGVVVRFGVNGDGVRPNYQVEAPPTAPRPIGAAATNRMVVLLAGDMRTTSCLLNASRFRPCKACSGGASTSRAARSMRGPPAWDRQPWLSTALG